MEVTLSEEVKPRSYQKETSFSLSGNEAGQSILLWR